MRTVKYRMELFSLFDYQTIQQHLSRMEETGWRLEKTGVWFWKYSRCEPAKTAYEVTYLPEASAYEPLPLEKQADLADYCAAFGWELVADINQLQIFRNSSAHPTPIETDEALRLKMIRKSMRRDFVPVRLFLLVFLFAMTGMLSAFYSRHSILDLFTSTAITTFSTLILSFIMVTGELLCYLLWIFRSKRRIKQGSQCAGTHILALSRVTLITLLMLLLIYLWEIGQSNHGQMIAAVLSAAIYILLLTAAGQLYRTMKRHGVDQGALLAWLIFLSIFAAFFQQFMQRRLTDSLASTPEEPVEYVNVSPGVNVMLTQDEIILKVEDLFDTDYPNYSYWKTNSSSLLMARYCGSQIPLPQDSQEPALDYEVYNVKFSPLYDLCLRELLAPDDPDNIYREESPTPWNADNVWRKYFSDGTSMNTWLLCKDGIIAEFELHDHNWELTDAQKAVVGEKLLNPWT